MSLPAALDLRPCLLLGPGPSDAHPNVLKAMATPLLGHLDPQFMRVMNEVQEMLRAALLTRGNHGMMLFETGRDPADYPIVGTGEVVDVSGAGDTVVAAFTAAWLAGVPLREAAWISNCAASVVVMKVGAATCSPAELVEVLRRSPPPK